jgi:hypothetical protein
VRYEVHSAAECFRLMREEELDALASDIRENGLRDPVVLAKVDGVDAELVVDGRNRLLACERAEVEPKFETVQFKDDDEVKRFVRSRSERRDLSKGEKAMALALLYPEERKHGGARKKGSSLETKLEGFSKARLSQARAVLRHSRPLAESVRDGVVKLDEAIAKIKAEQESRETDEAKLVELRADAPDLADLVDEDRLSLSDAHAAFKDRKEKAALEEENKRETLIRLSEAAYSGIVAWSVDGFVSEVESRLDDPAFKKSFIERLRLGEPNQKGIKRGAEALAKIMSKL